ncbi:MAG: hypothetical protein QOG89_2235 [Thermomicrobiales bacterium]|jgi:hypothetical protein|nr:hypothetical protein [Thermomicrobiales bacterium]
MHVTNEVAPVITKLHEGRRGRGEHGRDSD